jgi:DNA-binding transcriptional LysR family regulator
LQNLFSILKTMEWDDLKYFLAVARSGSLTESGRALRTSPATVAGRQTAVVSSIGAPQLDRRQSGYVLTESGQAIRLRVQDVEDAVLTVERQALGRDLRPSGKVRVATTDDIATLIIAPRMAELRSRFPQITLEIVARQDVANLTRRDADVALRLARPTHASYLVRKVGQWNLALYAARTYVEANSLKPGLRDLSKVALITWTAEGSHFVGGPWLREHARDSAVALTASTRRIHYAACRAGIGAAILPCVEADRDQELVRLLPSSRVSSMPLWLVVHRDLARTPRVRAVMDFLSEAAAKASR